MSSIVLPLGAGERDTSAPTSQNIPIYEALIEAFERRLTLPWLDLEWVDRMLRNGHGNDR